MHVDPTVEVELGPKPLSKPPGQAFLPSIQGNGALSPTWGRDIAKKKGSWIQLLPCARHWEKRPTNIRSFISHNNSMAYILSSCRLRNRCTEKLSDSPNL